MKMGSQALCRLGIATLLTCFFTATAGTFAARPDDKKPKRPKFGSSLKRLKWDEAKRTGVEAPVVEKAGPAVTGDDAIKLETLMVTFDVLVVTREGQQVVTGLKKEDFAITEDGQPQHVAIATAGDDVTRPRSIVLILDYSASQGPYLNTSLDAAKVLINKLGPGDEMAIVTDDVELMSDFTRDKEKLIAVLDKLRKRVFKDDKVGKSLQFSALYASLRELLGDKESRPVVIFQGDGDEVTSLRDQPDAADFAFLRRDARPVEFGLADILAAAEKSRATIYTVVTNDRLIGVPANQVYQRGVALMNKRGYPLDITDKSYESTVKRYTTIFVEGQKAAARVATLSGGWTAWLENPEQAETIYSQILSDMNRRYLVGYYPTNTDRDGKQRTVKIEIKGRPEYLVHGRTKYYAPDQ
jgi:VWFA-related protein